MVAEESIASLNSSHLGEIQSVIKHFDYKRNQLISWGTLPNSMIRLIPGSS